MRWLWVLVFVAVLGFAPHAQAQRSASEIGAEVAALRAAVRVWTPEGWNAFLSRYPEGAHADLARQALASLARETPPTLDEARAALDRFTAADWNCGDMPMIVARMAPTVGVEALVALADGGDARAQMLIGWSMADGSLGFRRRWGAGGRLISAAAVQGFAPAQANMSDRLIDQDQTESLRLARLAAEAGNGCGQVALALAYARGRGGLSPDAGEAVRLYRLAAEQGNSFGQNNLANYYLHGAGGVDRDEAEAARLYRLSAEQGNPHGQNNLANMILNGRGGLEADRDEAVRLYRLAAQQGSSPARDALQRLADSQ